LLPHDGRSIFAVDSARDVQNLRFASALLRDESFKFVGLHISSLEDQMAAVTSVPYLAVWDFESGKVAEASIKQFLTEARAFMKRQSSSGCTLFEKS